MTRKRIFVLDTQAGDYIDNVLEKMIQILNDRPQLDGVRTTFNGIVIIADKNSTTESLRSEVKRKQKASRRRYKRSAVAKRRKKERKAEIRSKKHEVIAQIRAFNGLDKSNLEKTIAWLAEFQPLSDRIGVLKPSQAFFIVKTLEGAGYRANENTNEHFKKEDKENVARYIIGQTISMLSTRYAIHPMIVHFSSEWEQKFVEKVA